MIEIVCPNCQAHYQLPDGAIGPEGRKVSCASCSHKWRATLEESAEESSEESPAPAPAAEEKSVEEVLASVSSSGQDLPQSLNVTPPPATGGRDEQMAAIRKMLADLKESAKDVPESAKPDDEDDDKDASDAPKKNVQASRRWGDDEPTGDSLKDRIEDVDKLSRMVKGQPTGSGYDAAKLRKRHEKRAKRMQKARERRKKSGAFLSGFTFVAVVASAFTGLYVFHPQISAANPRMEPALTQYVTTIDRYRVDLKDTSEEWKIWLFERFGMLKDQAERRGFVKPDDAQQSQ